MPVNATRLYICLYCSIQLASLDTIIVSDEYRSTMDYCEEVPCYAVASGSSLGKQLRPVSRRSLLPIPL